MSSEEEDSVVGSEEEEEESSVAESVEEEEEESEEEESEEEEKVVVVKKRKPAAKGGKKKKDPNKPKRNMSAFFLFSNANRQRVKEENPEAKFGDIVSLFCLSVCQCWAVMMRPRHEITISLFRSCELR